MAVCCFFAVKNLPIMDIFVNDLFSRYAGIINETDINTQEVFVCVTFIFVSF